MIRLWAHCVFCWVLLYFNEIPHSILMPFNVKCPFALDLQRKAEFPSFKINTFQPPVSAGQRTLHHQSEELDTVILVNPDEPSAVSEVKARDGSLPGAGWQRRDWMPAELPGLPWGLWPLCRLCLQGPDSPSWPASPCQTLSVLLTWRAREAKHGLLDTPTPFSALAFLPLCWPPGQGWAVVVFLGHGDEKLNTTTLTGRPRSGEAAAVTFLQGQQHSQVCLT